MAYGEWKGKKCDKCGDHLQLGGHCFYRDRSGDNLDGYLKTCIKCLGGKRGNGRVTYERWLSIQKIRRNTI